LPALLVISGDEKSLRIEIILINYMDQYIKFITEKTKELKEVLSGDASASLRLYDVEDIPVVRGLDEKDSTNVFAFNGREIREFSYISTLKNGYQVSKEHFIALVEQNMALSEIRELEIAPGKNRERIKELKDVVKDFREKEFNGYYLEE